MHVVSEKSIVVATGHEPVLNKSASQLGAAFEIITHLAFLKGAGSVLSKVRAKALMPISGKPDGVRIKLKNGKTIEIEHGEKISPRELELLFEDTPDVVPNEYGGEVAPSKLPTKPQHPDVPNYPKSPRSKPVTSATKPGEYVYVQDAEGGVHAVPQGPHTHPTVLGEGTPAVAAGEIIIDAKGVVTEINNINGTFQHDASVLNGVKAALEKAGLKVAPDAIKPFQN